MPSRNSAPSPSSVGTARSRRRRPIQLAALRGFDAAARHLSFTLAAQELNLTQSSISRQIAALEREVGKALFIRRTRALELTAAGDQLARSVRQALAGVDRTVDELRGIGGPPRISLTTYASFASLWLVPRLAGFQRLHPEAELRIDASDRWVNLEREDVDLAVRWCGVERAPAGAQLMVEEEITPVLSPDLLERVEISINTPADLLRLPLLEMDDGLSHAKTGSWAQWLQFAGVALSDSTLLATRRLYFTYVDQSVQAALRGQGVVLGRTPFLDDLLASGKVIAPFPQLRMRTGHGFYIVSNQQRSGLPQVAAFREWLIEEFARGPRRDT